MADNITNSIKKWEEKIDLGIEYRKIYGLSDRWPVYKQYYRGVFPGYNMSGGGILPYNLTYAMARTLVPNVYFRNPYVNITPRPKMGSQQQTPLILHANLLESVDNWLLQEMSVKKEMRTGVLDCFFTNRAFWKIGYDSQYGFAPNKTEDALGMEDATLTAYDKKGHAIEYNINVKPGMPWVFRTNPEDMIVPFGVRTLDDCPWIAHRVLRPLEDVKADPKYKNTRDLEGTHLELLMKDPRKAQFYQKLTQISDWVEIIEVRDRKRKEIFAFVYGHPKYLREPEEDVLQIEGLPYVDMTFNEDVDYYWGPSDVTIMEPQQLECNDARTQAMNHRRVSIVKFLVDQGIIDDKEIAKMISENVAPVVKVRGNPNQATMAFQPHIPHDLTMWVEQIRSDVRELMGFSRQAMGEVPQGRRTAYEVGIAQMAKEIRVDERRDAMADALTELVRKVNQIIFERWDERHVVQVVGVEGARYWVEYTRDAIVGEYNVKVDVESMVPTTKAMKKRELIELIGALAQVPGSNVSQLLRALLREFDYVDAMAILPEAPETAGGQAMPFQQFAGQQQKLMQQPGQLRHKVGQTQRQVGAGLS